MINIFITIKREDEKGNETNFHVFGNCDISTYVNFSLGDVLPTVKINISSYISREKFESGFRPIKDSVIILNPGNCTLDFSEKSDQLTPDKLGKEIAIYLGGDGSEYVIEDIVE